MCHPTESCSDEELLLLAECLEIDAARNMTRDQLLAAIEDAREKNTLLSECTPASDCLTGYDIGMKHLYFLQTDFQKI